MNLVLRPAAAADIEEAFLWYEAQRSGLGQDSLRALDHVLQILVETPKAFPVVHRGTRRAHVTRFRTACSIASSRTT